MSCSASECERTTWIIGVAGTCNNVTGLCECPPGFTGKDVWENFNSCHIPEDLIRILNVVYLVAVVIASAIVFGIIVYVFIKWQFYSSIMDSLRSAADRSQSVGSRSKSLPAEGNAERPSRPKPVAHVSKRRRQILGALIMMFLYPVFSIPYAALNVLDPPIYRYELPWVADMTLAISISFLYSGYWLVLYIYYKSLPDLRMIGKLMHLKSIFIERPTCK